MPRLVRLSPDLWAIQTINLLTHTLTAPAPTSVPTNPCAMQELCFLPSKAGWGPTQHIQLLQSEQHHDGEHLSLFEHPRSVPTGPCNATEEKAQQRPALIVAKLTSSGICLAMSQRFIRTSVWSQDELYMCIKKKWNWTLSRISSWAVQWVCSRFIFSSFGTGSVH